MTYRSVVGIVYCDKSVFYRVGSVFVNENFVAFFIEFKNFGYVISVEIDISADNSLIVENYVGALFASGVFRAFHGKGRRAVRLFCKVEVFITFRSGKGYYVVLLQVSSV